MKTLKPFAKPLNRYTCGIGLGIDRIIMAAATGSEVQDKQVVNVILEEIPIHGPKPRVHVIPPLGALGFINANSVIVEFSPMTMTLIGKQYVIPFPAAILGATGWTTGEMMEYQFLETDGAFHIAIWRAQ